MGIIILVGLIIGYIVLAVLAAKTWQTLHVVLLVGVFLASVGFSILAAGVLKTQSKHRTEYNKQKAQLDRELAKQELLLKGNPADSIPSLRTLEGSVRRDLVDRGRVWRNLRLADRQETSFVLDASGWGDDSWQRVGLEEDDLELEDTSDEGEVTANVTPLSIDVGAVVFAFGESPIAGLSDPLKEVLVGEQPLLERDTQGICKVPVAFLGQFQISQVAEDSTTITIEPSIPLDELQQQAVLNPEFTWVLYEKLPLDTHESFQGLTEDQLKVLMPAQNMRLDETRYQQLIQEYARDHQRAEPADPPERKWSRVRFLKSLEFEVDVQGDVAEPTSPFDATGRAQSKLLAHEDGKVNAEKDQEVLLDEQTASRLEGNGDVEIIEPVYVRRLRDYDVALINLFRVTSVVDREIAQAESDLQLLNDSNEKLREQIAYRQEERNRLQHDSDGFQYEQQVITEYYSALQTQWESIRSDLSRLYRANRQIVNEGGEMRPVAKQATD